MPRLLTLESNALQAPKGFEKVSGTSHCRVSTEEAVGEESQDVDESIGGRTTDGEFHTFFDEKTFGLGEAGEAPACLWDTGLKARMRPSPSALLCRLWPAAFVREEVAGRQNGKGAS